MLSGNRESDSAYVFSAIIIPYLKAIVKSVLSIRKICGAVVKEKARRKK